MIGERVPGAPRLVFPTSRGPAIGVGAVSQDPRTTACDSDGGYLFYYIGQGPIELLLPIFV